MNTETWFEANNRYIAASLQWLRLRLLRLAPAEPPVAEEPSPPQATAKSGWFHRRREAISAVAARESDIEEQIRQAAAEREAAAEMELRPALILLAQRLDLSAFERDTLLLCAAMELDPGMAALCARAQGNPARNYPTFGLAPVSYTHLRAHET